MSVNVTIIDKLDALGTDYHVSRILEAHSRTEVTEYVRSAVVSLSGIHNAAAFTFYRLGSVAAARLEELSDARGVIR